MFANKFHYDLYPPAYDCLEQWYFTRVHREEQSGKTDLDVTVYSNLDIVKHAFKPTDPDPGHHNTWLRDRPVQVCTTEADGNTDFFCNIQKVSIDIEKKSERTE